MTIDSLTAASVTCFVGRLALALTPRSTKVRTDRGSSQDLTFEERRQNDSARAAIESPEACGLRHGQTQPWHLAVLALHAPQELVQSKRRGDVDVAAGLCDIR